MASHARKSTVPGALPTKRAAGRGLSLKQLAELSEVPLWRIRRYESGTLAPDIEDFTKLACALDIAPAKFFAKVMREIGR
jgi:transcriptional regulator with XRE-family HTH domain